MYRRFYSIIFILLFLAGCSTIRPKFVDPTGRDIPSPHFVLQGIETPIAVLFYYTTYEAIRDVDGTIIGKPTYLDFFDVHDVYAEKVKAITLTIEVSNPTRIEYNLYEHTQIQRRSSGEIRTGDPRYKSNLEYRQYVFKMPYGYDIRDVEQYVSLKINNDEILRTGDFRYHLIF